MVLGRLFFLLYLSFSRYPVEFAAAVCLVQPCLLTSSLPLQLIGGSRKARRKLQSKRRKTETKRQIRKSRTRAGMRTTMKMRKGWRRKSRMKRRKWTTEEDGEMPLGRNHAKTWYTFV